MKRPLRECPLRRTRESIEPALQGRDSKVKWRSGEKGFDGDWRDSQ
jgi:hypothetical protein